MTIGQAKAKPYWFALCLTDVFYFSSVRYSFICCALSGFYLYFVLSYTKILSRSTDSCAKGSKVPSDTKSTFLPKSSSKSLHMPKNFKSILFERVSFFLVFYYLCIGFPKKVEDFFILGVIDFRKACI